MKNQPSLKINAILNVVRRGSAILFPVITFSYASHQLGAAKIGAFSFCNSVIGYFLIFAALGISTYAVREGQVVRDDINKLTRFISEVYTINVLMTVVSYILLCILFLVWSKLHGYREMLFLLSISIVITTIGADWINTLLEDYLYITIRYIAIQVISFALLVIFVKKPDDIYKYVIISLFASVGGNLFNIWYIRHKIHFHLTKTPNIRQHIIPMLTLFSNNMAIQIYLIADIIILGIFIDDESIGCYSVASKVYTSIKELINAMIFVTVPRFSYYISHQEKDKYNKSFNDVSNAVISLLLPCIVGLIFQSDNIIYFLGGSEYAAGVPSLRILSVALFFAVGACLLSQSVLIPNKMEKYFLRATIISAITNIVFNFLLIKYWGITAAAATTLGSEVIAFIVMLYLGRNSFPRFEIKKSDIPSAVIGSAVVAIVCWLINIGIGNKLINMIISIIVSAIAYCIVLYFMHNQTIRNVIKRS